MKAVCRRLDAVVVPQRGDDVGDDQVGRVLGDQLEYENAVLSQVALGEAARQFAVTLAARRSVAPQPRHDLKVLSDVPSATAFRQQDPRPAHQAHRRQCTEQRQPEPQHQVDLLAEEVDRQDALNGVRVYGSHVTADGEVAEGYARENVRRAAPLPPGDNTQQYVDAEQVVAAAEEVIEQVELTDDVQQVQQLGAGVQEDEIVAASIAANEVVQKASTTDCHTLLTCVTTCISYSNRKHVASSSQRIYCMIYVFMLKLTV